MSDISESGPPVAGGGAPHDCGRNQQQLGGFIKDSIKEPGLYGHYFFKAILPANETKQLPTREIDRCLKCGRTIGEHHQATGSVQQKSSVHSPTTAFNHLPLDSSNFVVPNFAAGQSLADVAAPPAEGAETVVQAWFTNLATSVTAKNRPASTLKSMGLNDALTVDGEALKPDGVLYSSDMLNEPSGIIAVVELKKPGPQLLPAHQHQILKYLDGILRVQPFRDFCYGLLTNGEQSKVYKAVRLNRQVTFQLVCSHDQFRNGALLAWFLKTPVATLGWSALKVTLDGVEFPLKHLIGSGLHCDAYMFTGTGTERRVMKHYRDEAKADNERTVCCKIEHVSNVAHLAATQPKEPNFVLIQQLGFPFDKKEHKANTKHAKCLRDALQALHTQGIAHCDIHEGNIYFIDEQTAMLNDWSHAQFLEDTAGAKPTAPTTVKHEFIKLCRDDFNKLTKAILALAVDGNVGAILDDDAFARTKRKRDADGESSKASGQAGKAAAGGGGGKD
jgi:hypothetical protein